MFYIIFLLFLIILGFGLAVKNYYSVKKTYLKLIELNNLLIDFFNNNDIDDSEKLNLFRITLSKYLHFYNQKMSRSIKISIFSQQVDPFNHFVLNHDEPYMTEYDIKFLRKIVDGIVKSFTHTMKKEKITTFYKYSIQ